MVTGASSGIGLATALGAAARGDSVVLAARAAEPLERAAEQCRGAGARALVVPTDVRDSAAVEALRDAAIAAFGRIDAWVHSAAVMAYGRVEDIPAAVFDDVIATDLLGAVNAARAVLPRFREQEAGTLVLVGSLLDRIVTPRMGPYVVSRWGTRALTRILQLETRDAPGVHVCTVVPASVDTPIYRQAANYAGFVGRPPPPIDPPEKVARAVLRTLDSPRRTRVVGPTNRFITAGFVLAPRLFDTMVGPLLSWTGLSREPVPPGPGNVQRPHPGLNALRGGWGRLW